MHGPWINPNPVVRKNFVAVADGKLLVGAYPGDSADEIMAAARAGDPPKPVDLSRLMRIRASHRNDEVEITTGSRIAKQHTILEMANASDRDALVAALETLPGHTLSRRHVVMSPLRATVQPIIALLFIAFATWALFDEVRGATGDSESFGGRNQGIGRVIKWIGEMIGPTGVIIVGALLCIGCVAYMVLRIKKPPIFDELKPGK